MALFNITLFLKLILKLTLIPKRSVNQKESQMSLQTLSVPPDADPDAAITFILGAPYLGAPSL